MTKSASLNYRVIFPNRRGVIAVGENGEAFLRNSLSLPFAIIGFTAIFAALVNS
jgi:hypothetical protein